MTKDEALKMAYKAEETGNLQDLVDAVNALMKALEQPAQKPVSLGDFDNMSKAECVDYIEYLRKEIDLLRFKEWQGLTDDEICNLWSLSDKDIDGIDLGYTTQQHYFAALVEQALKEKNT